MIETSNTQQHPMDMTKLGLQKVLQSVRNHKLKLASQKTEALLISSERKLSAVKFDILDTTIIPNQPIKYFELWLNTKLTFLNESTYQLRK